jgi:excinuclease ABC subunit C
MAKADTPRLPDLSALPSGEAAPAATTRTGLEVIAGHVKRLPSKPGVYRMIGVDGEVLYVGKARNLKNRVTTYARGVGHTNGVTRMLNLVADMEFVTTGTEAEALLLEANMIKRLRPRFNVMMRDDKSFPYIVIRNDHDAPQIAKHRGARAKTDDVYGPFASAWAVNRSLTTLQKAFLLRSCSDSVYASRTRPCMLHQIKRCAAPCVGLVDKTQYAALVDEARAFLSGKSDDLQARMAGDMEKAAEALDFETAARLRDRIRALASITSAQGINPRTFAEADVFAIAADGGMTCIQVFFFRAGQNWGNRAYFPRHEKDATPADVLEAFVAQFYDAKPVPPLILTSEDLSGADLLGEALGVAAGRKVTVAQPQRGEKREIVAHAQTNAREALGRKLAESGTTGRLLDGLQRLLDLNDRPERIEVYDNSHIQGAHAVGAMIVAGPDGFEKGQYRKWTIKEATPGDDFAMMREVLARRFARLLKDEAGDEAEPAPISQMREDGPAWPDLILIDGGAQQLAVALEVAREAGVDGDIAIASIAKGVDRDAGHEAIHMPGRAPFRMPRNDPVLYYLQRLRDEAHRFAIGAHRQKRAAALTSSPLDEIAGIGPGRKKALLARFGSARGVARAALADLKAVPGVSEDLAARIHAHFQQT